MKARNRRAVLRWRDGSTATASLEDGWRCDNQPLEAILNVGWPLTKIIVRERPTTDPLASMAREVAKIFSAHDLEIA